MSFGSADDSRHHITHIKTRETSMSLSVLTKFALLRSLRSCPLDQEFIGFVILGRPRNCATLMIIGVSLRLGLSAPRSRLFATALELATSAIVC